MNSTIDCSSLSTFPTNPDITGIGARVAIYVSMVLGPVLYLGSHDKDRLYDAARTSLLTTAGMIVAGLISLHTPGLGLSLIDAQIIALFSFTTTFCYYALFSAITVSFSMGSALIIHAVVTSAFGIFVYTHADTFGGDACLPQCIPNASFKFSLFGHLLSSTDGSLVTLALVVFALVAALTGNAMISSRGRVIMGALHFISEGWQWLRSPPDEHRVRRQSNRTTVTNALLRVSAIAIIVFLMATVELTIYANGLSNMAQLNQLTFGQTMPLLLLILQILSAASLPVEALYEYLLNRPVLEEESRNTRDESDRSHVQLQPITSEPENTAPGDYHTVAEPGKALSATGRMRATNEQNRQVTRRSTVDIIRELGARPSISAP